MGIQRLAILSSGSTAIGAAALYKQGETGTYSVCGVSSRSLAGSDTASRAGDAPRNRNCFAD